MTATTWEVIVWAEGAWWRTKVTHPTKDAAELCAAYITRLWADGVVCRAILTAELERDGLPAAPPDGAH